MPKALPPAFGPLKFHGRMDWPPEDRIDDWGLTPSQQESYVEQFRRVLNGKNAYREVDHDYYLLRRFLRARTYDIERATQMWLDSQRWREEFKVDTILQDFYFEEREAFLKTYPQGYHKTDKMGRPVYVQEIGKINLPELKKATTEERMIKFHIQEYERCCKVILPICSELAKKNIDTTFGIMDVKGVGLGHLTGEVKRIMSVITKYDQDNYPEMLGHICIINAPAVFRMLWGVVKGMLDVRTQSKIEILGPNYADTLLQWVDAENLPVWLGGKSEGTLYDDVGPWSDMALVTSLGLSVEELKAGRKPRMVFTSPTMQRSLTHRGPGSGASVIATRVKSDASKTDGVEPEFARLSSGRATEALDLAGIKSINYTAQLATVAERPRTLVERVAALEALLPGQLERLKNDMRSDEAKEKMSTRSAPEGTLLHRIEVLEDAMDTLLAAEAAQLETVQAMQAVQQVKDAPHVRQGCGCVVM